jgi:hypothetical protein
LLLPARRALRIGVSPSQHPSTMKLFDCSADLWQHQCESRLDH